MSCAVEPANCRRCAKAVPWFSLWGNLALGVYKLVVGTVGRSQALVADALHSFADVIGSTGILIATKVSSKDPDDYLPYGRGKAEFIGAAFVYTVLLFFAGGISFTAIKSIISGEMHPPHFVTVLGAVVSVLYNFIMYKYATCVGQRNHSPAILADAFENRADAISSVACIGGILGAMFVHPICDPIAALVVGIIIFFNCKEQLIEAAKSLMDGGLEPEDVEKIRGIVARQPGVVGVPFLRTRRTGARFWFDVGIEVSPDTGVEEADRVAMAIRGLVKRHPQSHHVEVYVSSASENHNAGAVDPQKAIA